jgi:hypothetical protein
VTTDTDALLATVREGLRFDFHATQHIAGLQHDGHDLRAIHTEDVDAIIAAFNAARPALDSLAAELEVLSRKLTREIVEHADTDAELERVKAERDASWKQANRADQWQDEAEKVEARLDRALSALRLADEAARTQDRVGNEGDAHAIRAEGIRAAIAEIEGEA